MKTLSRLVTVIVAMLSLASMNAIAENKPPIKLALSTPLSGPLGPSGKVQSIAVKLAVQDVNESGGINGSNIDLLVYDDQFNPAQGLLRVREAFAAGAVAIMGPYGSTQWETAAPLLNQLKMPGINLSATKAGITVPPYSLRVSHPDNKSTPEGLAEFVKVLPAVKRVAVMGDVREASGRAVIDQWVNLAKAAGLEVVDVLTYTSTQTDLSPYAIKLKELQPDALLVGMLPADAIRFSRELHIQGVKFPVLANAMIYSGVFPQTSSKTIGEDAGRWYVVGFTTNEYASGDPDKHRKFVQRFIEEVNKDPALAQFQPPNVANSSLGYDGVLLIADMLTKQGVDGNTPIETAREKLKDAMTGIKHFRGVNEFFFDNNGEGAPRTKLLRVDPSRGMYILANP